jgi:peptide methionine sulfoxide reductase msrA/msrB
MTHKSATLTPNVLQVVGDKDTEHPFTGIYDTWDKPGTYLCRQCGLALFRSSTKFHSGCGWPSFDEEIDQAVLKQPDFDGQRVEILCQRCHAHLGHEFQGEGYTNKNIRHCVNSLSLDFVDNLTIMDTEEGLFAAGCFWGVEYYFKKLPGVLKTEVGYSGGQMLYPSYQKVCEGKTGHLEAIRVLYDPKKITYPQLVQYFFEIHDPEQIDGQGPDKGHQYLSAIFYENPEQQKISQEIIQHLLEKKYKVSTKIYPATTFWKAEEYHQEYYLKSGKTPYCHRYTKRF